jgi:hypothetical protein
MELANGAEGYIPPPAQHPLGGYTTWPARSAGLEVEAEPKILGAVLTLLEQVSGKARRGGGEVEALQRRAIPYVETVLASKPIAYWRLGEFRGPRAWDAIEGLPRGTPNPAVHLAGGHVEAELEIPAEEYAVDLWFWNGLPEDARTITGVILSVTRDNGGNADAITLGISGKGSGDSAGRLLLSRDTSLAVGPGVVLGTTKIPLRTWHRMRLERSAAGVKVYLGDRCELDVEIPRAKDPSGGEASPGAVSATTPRLRILVGAAPSGDFSFEGKIDEVVVHAEAPGRGAGTGRVPE